MSLKGPTELTSYGMVSRKPIQASIYNPPPIPLIPTQMSFPFMYSDKDWIQID